MSRPTFDHTKSEGQDAPVLELDPLPPLSERVGERVVARALAANDAYTRDFVEKYFLCPFAKEGRRRGETRRKVVWLSTVNENAFVEPLSEVMDDASCVVLQVIFPGLRVAADTWIDLCAALTRRAHFLLDRPSTFVVAALHPELSFGTTSPYTLIPLFRRAPDPTIQWVRLSALEELSRGREKGSSFIDPAHLMSVLSEQPVQQPLYDRVAQTNWEMAQRHGISDLERALKRLHAKTQRDYVECLSESLSPTNVRGRAR